jgi:DNA adenine methylase
MSGAVPRAWSPPFLRWAGSKRKLLPILLRTMPPQYKRYFEPFVGSGCFFFALRPRRAVIGDINADLMTAYSALQLHPRLLHRRIASLRLNRRSYYVLRDRHGNSDDVLDDAARFIALNRYCFNGLYRANSAGKFNVPFGTRHGVLPSETAFYRASVALRGCRLVTGDFVLTLRNAEKGDFVYLDPPYVYSDRRDRGEYGPGTFKLRDMTRLFKSMRRLHKLGAYVLLSFLETPEVVKMAQGWNVKTIPVQRQISGFAHFRKVVNEVLISNYAISD